MKIIILISLIFLKINIYSNDSVNVIHSIKKFQKIDNIQFFKPSNDIDINTIIKQKFVIIKESDIRLTNKQVWFKLDIINKTKLDSFFLEIENPSLENISLYTYSNRQGGIVDSINLGKYQNFNKRPINIVNYAYPLNLKYDESVSVYIKIKSLTPLNLPIFISSKDNILYKNLVGNLVFGVYIGIIVIMIVYHFFIFLFLKDNVYAYYILYIFFVGVAQFILKGYAFKYLWPENTFMAIHSFNYSGIFSGLATLVFSKIFLQTNKYAKKLDSLIICLICIYLLCIISQFVNRFLTFQIINICASVGSIVFIYTSYIVVKRNYRPARFFLVAFSTFLIAVIIYVLRTSGYLPYNNFTSYILEIGSAIQITLLSLALADRINIYRAEQRKSELKALEASMENERLVREQNITLEKQVNERTIELRYANTELNTTLETLKSAQSQLVNSEKMASLGQLTAGIAHEINNPINFVTSNVQPLQADFDDIKEILKKYDELDISKDLSIQLKEIDSFKKEIDIDYIHEEITTLLGGIREGAQRTAEIVKGLRNFARVDEVNLKSANLNEGINSTLLLLNNTFPKNFKLIRNLGNIPSIDCVPGKINQVFMNIITNAIQAIKAKKTDDIGILEITTQEENSSVKITIRDNGTGIPDEIKEKIFDPFFTTKDVGEGTGLGLSIVQGIIKNHEGTIELETKVNEGTTFIITLPKKLNTHPT